MSAKKMKLTSASHSDFTLEALRQIAPSAFTEVRGEHGELTHKVDFEALKELLGDNISNSNAERFGFHWVGKQDAKRAAAEPTRKTLLPVPEDSVDWDNTQNLYIEGDNLEVLKLLQRAYLGKVKMIYIDPPYNTGNDFVYLDDFSMSQEKYDKLVGNVDAEGKRLRANVKTHARYHSDWCSMLYSRLLVARSLLTQDGVIFISIDDNEVHHLRMICDEVFGASNFVAEYKWNKTATPPSLSNKVRSKYEYILCYEKQLSDIKYNGGFVEGGDMPLLNEGNAIRTLRFPKDSISFHINGSFDPGEYNRVTLENRIEVVLGVPTTDVVLTGPFKWTQETVDNEVACGTTFMIKSGKFAVRYMRAGERIKRPSDIISKQECGVGTNEDARKDIEELFGANIMSYPKPVSLIQYLIPFSELSPDSLILDFFSGSATTAHAVMQLNAEDGGKRKYICVQLPEETPEGSEARKAGYSTICEIGKERIRRAGKDILGNLYGKQTEILSNFTRFAIGEDVDKDPKLWQYIEDEATREQAKQELKAINERIQNLDTGFRVLCVDTSNMEEVYFEPAVLEKDQLFGQVDSVKEDRNDLDLLFGCMVDLGMELSLPIRKDTVGSSDLYIVNEGTLVACFDAAIDLKVIGSIASIQPQHVLFRESCFATDADKLNIYEQFKQRCGWSTEESSRRIHII